MEKKQPTKKEKPAELTEYILSNIKMCFDTLHERGFFR